MSNVRIFSSLVSKSISEQTYSHESVSQSVSCLCKYRKKTGKLKSLGNFVLESASVASLNS